MIKFEYESHEPTPEDQYCKEVVTFKFTADGESWYVPYFHKLTKEGGTFWSTASAGVQMHGKKKYFEGFDLDSRHRTKQVMEFLTERKWEKSTSFTQTQNPSPGAMYYPHGLIQPTQTNLQTFNATPPTSMSEMAMQEQLPF